MLKIDKFEVIAVSLVDTTQADEFGRYDLSAILVDVPIADVAKVPNLDNYKIGAITLHDPHFASKEIGNEKVAVSSLNPTIIRLSRGDEKHREVRLWFADKRATSLVQAWKANDFDSLIESKFWY